MSPNQREPSAWVGDLFSGLLDAFSNDALEVVYWMIKAIVHVLFVSIRVVFHLLSCHF